MLQIVKELLVKESDGSGQDIEGDWCPEEELPEETRCKVSREMCCCTQSL